MKHIIKIIVLFSASVLVTPVFGHEYSDDHLLVKQFKKLDTNSDGYVSKAEVVAQPEYTKFMDVSIAGSFEMGDINSDGLLDLPEFFANEEEIPAE